MEIYKEYSRFKASCEGFKNDFNEQFFSTGTIFCHPLMDGVIYTSCTEEEARSDIAAACRMSDMLIMSEDGETFIPFKINEAREIAARNGSVFIADLLGKGAFEALDWMIDGKHDTVIISEEHMKKEGKPYAPVTPLTNVIQPFKKSVDRFLYKKGTVEDPAVISDKDIDEKIKAYADNLVSDFINPEIVGTPEFEIFGSKIKMDKNESACMELDRSLSAADSFEITMDDAKTAFETAEYDFDKKKALSELFVKAAAKCGVTLSADAFASCEGMQAFKSTYRKLVSEKNSYGFKYSEPDKAKTAEALKAVEMSSSEPEALKKEISELLVKRPVCRAVFNIARATSPTDAEAVENISEYWNSSAMTPTEIAEYLRESYIPADAMDEDGRIICGGVQAKLICEEIKTAAAKYKIRNVPVIDELEEYCVECEKNLRTYNGTVFDSIEEMEKAVKNDKELSELCADLSALDKDELIKLRKYIYDMNLDKKSTGKYLLKIKIAMNSCQENQLKMLCTGITMKKAEELDSLKKRLVSDEFDEVLTRPYIAKIDDCILRVQLNELTEMFKDIPDTAKADSLEKALDSGRFDKMFIRHFRLKLTEARDSFAKKEIEEICKGIQSADKKALGDISAKLDSLKCRNALKAAARKAVDERAEAIDIAEAEKTFAGIASADNNRIAELRKIIASGRFKASITDKYAAELDSRETAIRNAEFIKKCDTIPQLDNKALDEIRAQLEGDKYPEELAKKYLPMIEEREKAIIKAELAAMCKDIASMDNAKLDELEAKLKDEKYDPELTTGYFDTIKGRRKTLINIDADNLCKNIANMDKAALAELTEKLKDEKFDQEYNKKHYDAISKRFDKIETDKLEQLCKDVQKMKKAELEKLAADIAALGYKKENTAPYLEKIRKLEISLMKAEIETLCKNIATTPRKELSKLKEALTSGEFDKELSAKYIEQIDKRTEELVKNELAELCKNIANASKDELIKMKLTISETPEFAEEGKAYAEKIDSKLKQLDKAEFDKQMASIEKLDMEELDKFCDDLEKRKPALEAKLYDASVAKCKERRTVLERAALDKLCADVASADIEKLHEIKENISEAGYTPEITFPYIKKVDEAINDRYVQYFTKMTEKVNSMSRAELVVLLEKITKNEKNCPDDMLQRYIGKINTKIKEADANALSAKCKNLGSVSEHRSFELIKDINAMDIDPDTKKRFITQIELHITNLKTEVRDKYVEHLKSVMGMNNINGVHFYVPGMSKVFENQYISIQKAYASTEQYELPVLIHEVTQGHTDDSYLLTVNALYVKGKNGFDHISIEQIDRFEAKKSLLATSIRVVEKNGKASDLPNGVDKKLAENAVKVLNSILGVIQKDKAAARMREAEEIKAAEEAKLREQEEERLAIEAARKKAEEAEKAPETKPEEVKAEPAKADEKAESAKTEDVKKDAVKAVEKVEPIKPIKPIQVVVSPIPEVKQIKPLNADKPADNKPAEAPKPADNKPAEAPKPADNKPTEAPKPADNKPAEAPKPADNKPAEAPKPADNKPAEAPKPRMKFCDQCGAKITSDTAKFCAECGNKLIK